MCVIAMLRVTLTVEGGSKLANKSCRDTQPKVRPAERLEPRKDSRDGAQPYPTVMRSPVTSTAQGVAR